MGNSLIESSSIDNPLTTFEIDDVSADLVPGLYYMFSPLSGYEKYRKYLTFKENHLSKDGPLACVTKDGDILFTVEKVGNQNKFKIKPVSPSIKWESDAVLSGTASGDFVGANRDDGSGKQYWTIERVPYTGRNAFYIYCSGVENGKTYLGWESSGGFAREPVYYNGFRTQLPIYNQGFGSTLVSKDLRSQGRSENSEDIVKTYKKRNICKWIIKAYDIELRGIKFNTYSEKCKLASDRVQYFSQLYQSQTNNFKCSTTIGEKDAFERDSGFSMSISGRYQKPYVSNGKIICGRNQENNNITRETKKYETVFTIERALKDKTSLRVTIKKYNLKVPYTATFVSFTAKKEVQQTGVWNGISHDIKVEIVDSKTDDDSTLEAKDEEKNDEIYKLLEKMKLHEQKDTNGDLYYTNLKNNGYRDIKSCYEIRFNQLEKLHWKPEHAKQFVSDMKDLLQMDGKYCIKSPYIIIVGISEYRKNENGYKNLPAVKFDVENMYNLFSKIYGYKHVYKLEYNNKKSKGIKRDKLKKFLEYHRDEIKKLTGQTDEESDEESDEEKEQKNETKEKENGEDIDSVIFIYSGHGTATGILTSDVKPIQYSYITGMFSNEEIDSLTGAAFVLAFDCCRGPNESSGNKGSGTTGVTNVHSSLSDQYIWNATSAGYVAKESKDKKNGSVFLHCVHEILKNSVKNKTYNSWSLQGEISTKVNQLVLKNGQGVQTPDPQNRLQYLVYFIPQPNTKDSILDTKDPSEWDIGEVGSWIGKIGYSEYWESFVNKQINGKQLLELTKDDLQNMGIKDGLDKIQQEIEKLKKKN